MSRRDIEIAVYHAMLADTRLSGNESVRNDPYWKHQAAYLGSLTEQTEKRSWTVADRPLLSWARMIAEEARESVDKTGSLPEYVGPILEPSVSLQEAIRIYKEQFMQRRLHQEGRLL